jgi:arylsulfatase A-like enzyme
MPNHLNFGTICSDSSRRRCSSNVQHWILFSAIVAAAFGQAHPARAESSKPPNVVLIMADDLGVEAVGCYGGTSYRTPNIDRLASQGIRFTHAHAQPLCTNTRIQLMTSKYNHRNWIAFGILDPKSKTIGHWMGDAGYATCVVGKWQLQSYDPPDYPGAETRRGLGMRVEDAGFEEYSLWHTGHTEVKGSRYADPVINENGKLRTDLKGKYGPDIWTGYIDAYLARHRRKTQAKKENRPFFIYYPMALPHWPFVATPDSKIWKNEKRRHEENLSLFTDMVQYTDKVVGRVVKSVDKHGFANNTLLIFYSDNGTHLKITSQTKTGPIAGGKGMPTDAGTHVPLIVRWPGTIEPGVNGDLIDSTDFAPTICEVADSPISAAAAIDGRSFYPQLIGAQSNPRDWIFCHFDPRPGWDKDRFRLVRFARTKQFKLYGDGRLYHTPSDRLEKQPLAPADDSPSSKTARRKLQRVLDNMASHK